MAYRTAGMSAPPSCRPITQRETTIVKECQLRRRARELLRAAANGEPRAVTRLRAVSERVTLSAAQLAVAREHGYRSWPALRAEVERGLSVSAASPPLPGGDEQGSLGAREER